MADYITLIKDWIIELGEKHDVDPLTLGCIYLVSKVCFFTTLGLALRNLKAKRPFVTHLLIACSFFSFPYMYIIIAGRNISVWVYLFMAALFISGAFSIWKKVTAKPVNVDPLP
ncbi:hypothetical protein [Mucilaginibacter glaciei]|uniref:Uncharacterized protein n=1 Tax=Mucilaginibacter glaciei TaxID=2772109 RepID=A0A926S2L8_9SPHI|nr:hypothetical protein [Mucilaginibacter glaciei]MBD1395260.1 hypothetical protein [Mucilaginibacter glaciei]